MKFISVSEKFNRETDVSFPAPVFFKEFFFSSIEKAYIYICSPNIAVCRINGKDITKDLFISPTSVWNKTLYFNKYRVDKFLKVGQNIITVMLGNGIKNEGVKSVWNLDKEPDRRFPEFALKIVVDGKPCLKTDESWKYTLNSPVVYNQFRIGEYVDTRIVPDFSCSLKTAVVDNNPPKGKLALCNFPPVRECKTLLPEHIKKTDSENFVVDFGQNISGYVELNATIPLGKTVKIVYAERITDDFAPHFGGMPAHFADVEFQTDKVIGNGKNIVFKPRFTYHGFRYVIINGLAELKSEDIKAHFIHHKLKQRIFFKSSNTLLNKLFDMSVNALLSNSVHLLTDCPTREKFGWMNDAMCSAETLLYLFDCKKFALKLLKDFSDTVTPDGKTVSIIPTCAWAYNCCHGIFAASAMFEFADKIYDIYGDISGYKIAYNACKRAIDRFLSEQNDKGLFIQHYGLGDWAGPYSDYLKPPAPLQFTDSVLMYKCLLIMKKAAGILGKSADQDYYGQKADALKIAIVNEYIGTDDRAVISEMSVLALLITFGLYNKLSPLKRQLKEEVEKHSFHHYCGMISLRYLYDALDKCGLEKYAYKIITAKGYPSYSKWIEDGDTSLCETWDNGASHNHHMFCSFTVWLIKTLCGLSICKGEINTAQPKDFVDKIKVEIRCGKNKFKLIKTGKSINYENN